MSEAEAWRLVYDLPKAPDLPRRATICFTGFLQGEKDDLQRMAHEAGFHVTGNVTKSLALLVCGQNAGPKKLEVAAEQGVPLLSAAEFVAFLRRQTPEGPPERLKDAVTSLVRATMKGSLFEPGPAPDMLASAQIREIEEAIGHAPLTRRELLAAADEYAAQLEAARELVPK